MNFNRNFNTNVWETPRPVNQTQPFVNNQQNFYQNQGNFQFQNLNPNFLQQNQNQNIRPLLSLPRDQSPQQFHNFNNNNNRNPDYRRPGPACSRNNNYGNNNGRWNKNRNRQGGADRKEDSSYRNNRNNIGNNNNRTQPRNEFEHQPTPPLVEPQPYKSLVDELKAVRNSKKNEHQFDSGIDEICAKNASEASKKLLTQIKTMDKDEVRDLINNPKQAYKKKVLTIQAREKLREQMRKKLNILGNDDNPEYHFEPDECIDYEKIPESLIAQIGRTMDTNFEHDEMDLSDSINEETVEDRDIEVVTKNLGNDFLMGSEMLLMNGFSLLGDEGDSEIKALEANVPKVPPLPSETKIKPPSPPPEPVPPPSLEAFQVAASEAVPLPVKPPQDEAAFCSVNRPWSPIRPSMSKRNYNEDAWGLESARNPDPPLVSPKKEPVIEVIKEPIAEKIPEQIPPISTPSSSVAKIVASSEPVAPTVVAPVAPPVIAPVVAQVNETSKPTTTSIVDKLNKLEGSSKPVVTPVIDEWNTPEGSSTKSKQTDEKQSSFEGRRANETYGEYRRRIASQREENVIENKESNENECLKNNTNNNQQRNQQSFYNNRGGSNGRNDSWMNNNRRNNNEKTATKSNDVPNNSNFNDLKDQSRPSRFDLDRGRDRQQNNFQRRNLSRDRNISREIKIENIKDGHNYRFQNERNSQEPVIDQLNTILHPKPLQFKGSFNVRTGHSNYNRNQRSRSRNRTPVNNSMERDFDINLLPPSNDARPCYYTLKKVMELDAEMSKIHEKVHGIDKVISNLQIERIAHQKSITKLQHDRKILFDNLMKRAMSNTEGNNDKNERESKENDVQPSTSTSASNKSNTEKKLQNMVDQKKRKHEEQPEEPKKKKQAIEVNVFETTSAAEKAAILQKERQVEERRLKNIERKRIKKLRRQREQNERARLEEKIRQEAAATTTVTIKQEPKHVEKTKSHKHQNRNHSEKPEKANHLKKFLFTQSEIMQIENITTQDLSVNLVKGPLEQSQLDLFKSSGFVELESESFNRWFKSETANETKTLEAETEMKSETRIKAEEEKQIKSKLPDNCEDPLGLSTVEGDHDPLAFDENLENPPTPGSNLTNEESLLVEVENCSDFSEWCGNFVSHDGPIVHLQNVNNKFIVCASETGKVYKYYLENGKLAAVFSKHTEICNSLLFDDRGSLYTVSSDGFLHKIKFKTFQLVASENFNEPLQAIEKSKAGIYVGTKSGSIFRLKPDLTERETEPICSLGALILCMRATKEGSRNILLVSSRTNGIQVRDASDGLLLRSLSADLVGVSIYDMLIEGSTIYCGSNRHEIFSVDFTSGALKKSRPCGAGAICVRLYKNYLIAACYDGNIYIFNINNDDDAVNICGPSNMLLAMDLWDDKIIATTKDKTLKVMNIPT